MTDRMNYVLGLLHAGESSGDMNYLAAWRQSNTDTGTKKGAVIAFQKRGMSMAMLLLGILPEKLMYSVVPLQNMQQAVKPFEDWHRMPNAEAESLINTWFAGDDDHVMAGTTSQAAEMNRFGVHK